MRIVALSDTHDKHKQLEIPDGDLLIHAGDFSMRADFEDTYMFADWMNSLPHKHKLVIPGNHDVYCEDNLTFCREIFYPVIFEDAGLVKFDDLTFLCYSWTPAPNPNSRWKFHPPYGDESMFKRFWDCAPPCDVLVTHGPPQGILDRVVDTYPGESPNVGEYHMRQYVLAMKPKVHLFGHIHESYGHTNNDYTDFYNISICTLQYSPTNPILVFDL